MSGVRATFKPLRPGSMREGSLVALDGDGDLVDASVRDIGAGSVIGSVLSVETDGTVLVELNGGYPSLKSQPVGKSFDDEVAEAVRARDCKALSLDRGDVIRLEGQTWNVVAASSEHERLGEPTTTLWLRREGDDRYVKRRLPYYAVVEVVAFASVESTMTPDYGDEVVARIGGKEEIGVVTGRWVAADGSLMLKVLTPSVRPGECEPTVDARDVALRKSAV